MAEARGRDWIFWDGGCALCRRAVDWVARRDTDAHYRIVAYQRAPSPPMTEEIRQACASAVHVVTAEGRVLKAGRACLYILEGLGYAPLARVLGVPPMVWMVELGYRVVASRRRFFSRFPFRS